MKTFIFSYDVNSSNLTTDQVHQFISDNKYISSWYLAFTGTYILKTNENGKKMTDIFHVFIGSCKYIMSEVDRLESTGGRLPNAAWSWFNSDLLPLLPSK